MAVKIIELLVLAGARKMLGRKNALRRPSQDLDQDAYRTKKLGDFALINPLNMEE
ncbi:hypothetical protein N8192_00190 [bacterium]|nr:hypothetical protein [bacterium]